MGTPECPPIDPELRQRLLATALRRGRRIRRARRQAALRATTILVVVALVSLGGLYRAHLIGPAGVVAPRPSSTPTVKTPTEPTAPLAPRVIATVSLRQMEDPTVALPGITAHPVTGDGAVWVLVATAAHPLELVGVKGSPPAIYRTIPLLPANDFATVMGNYPPVSPPVIIGHDAWIVVPRHLLEVNLNSSQIVRSTPDHYGTPQLLAAEDGSLWRFENGSTTPSTGPAALFPELQRIDLATGTPSQSIHLAGGCGGGALVPGPQGLWAETLACGVDTTVHVDLINPANGQVVHTLSYPVSHEFSIEAATPSALWGTEYGQAGSTHGLVAVSPSTGALIVVSTAPSDAWGLGASLGPSGLWSAGPSAVTLVDPATGAATPVIPAPVGSLLDGLAVGSHAVWIRDAAGLIEVRPS